MFSKVYSAAVQGIDATLVGVEVDVSDGLPQFNMVGALACEVKEARDRVRTAIKNSGFSLNPKKITVNLSPANIRKEGTGFDLPIAVAMLAAFGIIPVERMKETLIIGELSLNGEVERINGVLPITLAAKMQGFKRILVPKYNAREGACIQGITVIGVQNLKEVAIYLNNPDTLESEYVDLDEYLEQKKGTNSIDFADVIGQAAVKRAMEVAVAGMHNLLLMGPPGTGKTMLSKRLPTIMPDLTLEESMEISKVYSIAGLLSPDESIVVQRPFRQPHHTISAMALAGGGKSPKPGEVSLASGGILFLDELPEFNRNTLEILRQPMEERYVSISRLHGSYRYPTDFMLVGAMNPCPCGYYPDRNRCHCSEKQVNRYLSHLSKPLLDRIDIVMELSPVHYKEITMDRKEETSREIKERVEMARKIQMERYEQENFMFNSNLTPNLIKKYCRLAKEEKKLMEEIFIKFRLSARAYHRVLKVARTIADLDGAKEIQMEHLSEAVCYRSLENKFWGEAHYE
ncbi:Mg(2+) chelatase family protein / ComM-related protein [Lachnospiraceae bacterium KM106-2]|nr:Mg(2+) chelatase family protein / ComM-related protein [Lachnospiraceae bacterium KM106-2]